MARLRPSSSCCCCAGWPDRLYFFFVLSFLSSWGARWPDRPQTNAPDGLIAWIFFFVVNLLSSPMRRMARSLGLLLVNPVLRRMSSPMHFFFVVYPLPTIQIRALLVVELCVQVHQLFQCNPLIDQCDRQLLWLVILATPAGRIVSCIWIISL